MISRDQREQVEAQSKGLRDAIAELKAVIEAADHANREGLQRVADAARGRPAEVAT